MTSCPRGHRAVGIVGHVRWRGHASRYGISIAVPQLLAYYRAVLRSRMVVFGSTGRLRRYCSYQRNKKNGEEFPLHGHLHCWLPKIVATSFRVHNRGLVGRVPAARSAPKGCRRGHSHESQLNVFLRSKSAEMFPGVTALPLSKP